MDIEARLGEIARGLGASLGKGRKGVWTLEWLVAERKALLFRKKVTYLAKFRLDAEARELVFSEMVKETGAGAGEGSGPGMSFSKGTYKSGKGGREGQFEEQASLLGEKYKLSLDWGAVRRRFEQAATEAGWSFNYKVNPWKL